MTSPVAGFMTGRDSPLLGSTQEPPM